VRDKYKNVGSGSYYYVRPTTINYFQIYVFLSLQMKEIEKLINRDDLDSCQ